ncbi:DNA internalization-related competence protein ComEC/Rec2 [Paenibacillus sp. DXFW5]|uniref:DNA internalization-related competence protein ComEC/Rec2 n=1 Tax=Paenibacillus rhizolycopersici TaxID=2780073 RepID=A0ABS2H643_9BACL|nr:DNA internalization-related competence protein ComEC/Rec2 [Paenibacillus rhizolycopersici]MBM6994943.1 DNA internalization-related competence protein ComEC/Rec2 [Paenibacillus rhizolycopersici]
MNGRPLTAIACGWMAGSGLAAGYPGWRFWLFALGLSLICAAIALIGRHFWRSLVLIWLAFSLAGGYWLYNETGNKTRIGLPVDGQAVRLEGTIVSAVEIDGDRADFTLKASRLSLLSAGSSPQVSQDIPGGEKVAVQLRLAAQKELPTAASWRRGLQVTLDGTLEAPQSARNFGAFDYRRYLHLQRIHWLVKAPGASSIKVVQSTRGVAAVMGYIDALRDRLGERIERLFPEWQAGYMKGLLIGLQNDLDPDKYAEFTQLGLTHILAISGSHVAINVALLFGLLRLCRVTRETAITAALAFVPAYMLITGFSPSVIRSGLMTMLGLYLLRRGLLKDSLNVLAAAAMLMLVWDPYFLLNVSFQLSFAVTAGLILFVPLLSPYFRWLPRKMGSAVAITLAAQLVSFPLTILYFNQFSLLSVLANLLLVPVIGTLALPLGTGALLLSFLSTRLGLWAAFPVRWLNTVTFEATSWLSARSGFMTYWQSPSLLWVAAFYVGYYLVLYWGKRRERLAAEALTPQWQDDDTVPLRPVAEPTSFPLRERVWARRGDFLRLTIATGLVLLLISGYTPAYNKGSGYIEFIDVGQGDCALITTPSGKHLLVDGGGTVSFRKAKDAWRERREPFEVGAKTVVPLLKKRGVHRLDAVILTHGDQDHIGGAQAVLDSFPVEALLINGSLAESKTMTTLMETALTRRIPVYSASRGMNLQPDKGTRVEVLYPLTETEGTSRIPFVKEQNHQSIVFRLDLNGASFLFTGDMDEAAEREMLEIEKVSASAPTTPADSIDVMKVAHHGSKTSTSEAWLAYWQPETALISVGAANTYGHPHPTVVDRLNGQNIRIYRTDKQGEVQMRVRRGRIEVRSKLQQTP